MAVQRLPRSEHETFEEHRELFEAVDYIRRMLAGGAASRGIILHILRDLRKMLLEHFQHEEAEGYFAETARVAPHLTEHVERLLAEHQEMENLLTALIAGPQSQAAIGPWWRSVDNQYSHFVSLFLSHEAAENRLLQDLYNEDLGDGD